jgi:hypothetical protein
MRSRRFIAVHCGGLLSLEHHRLLMGWAHDCAVHLLPLLEKPVDQRLQYALKITQAWQRGEVLTGVAMRSSKEAHAVARELADPVAIAVARAIGQAVATAHMADHSLGATWYGLKAVRAARRSVDLERAWQNQHIPLEIRDLVLSARADKRI